MQKFTVFSIILSLAVVLAVADVLFHDYLNTTTVQTPVATEEPLTLPSTSPTTTPSDDSDSTVELQEVAGSSLTVELFQEAGFVSPTLKNTPFSGLVFQFLPFSDQAEADVFQSNLFDGPTYVGTVYEIHYSTDTGGFQGYLTLRDEANGLTAVGTTNEANNYGDASFYFNHKTKVKTVHLLIRSGSTLYGFEYAQSSHEKMKNVFDILKTLQ